MENEDSRFALFPEPNAYIQRYDIPKGGTRKVVFQEPYECMPNHYVNNNFKKGKCDCIPKPKENKQNTEQKVFPFDLKNLTPLLGMFKGEGIGNIASLLGGVSKGGGLGNILSMLTSNNGLSSLLSGLLKGGQKSNNANKKSAVKQTDFQIKEYTKVE
ncbi:MAG: hypothetical protein E7351_03440 [Clostridiales bacterium]|nr:hypothetical protein [Clostridiales bacterium]